MSDESTHICDNLDESSLEYVLSACACHLGLKDAKRQLKEIETADNARRAIENALDDAVMAWAEARKKAKEVYKDKLLVMPFCHSTWKHGPLNTGGQRCVNTSANIEDDKLKASIPFTDGYNQGWWENQPYTDGNVCKGWRQLCKRSDDEAEKLVLQDFNLSPSGGGYHPFFKKGEVWSEHMDANALNRIQPEFLHERYHTKSEIISVLKHYESDAVVFTFNCCSNSINCEGAECNDLVQDCVINNTQISGGVKESGVSGGVTEENIFISMTNNNYMAFGIGGIMLIILIILLIIALSSK